MRRLTRVLATLGALTLFAPAGALAQSPGEPTPEAAGAASSAAPAVEEPTAETESAEVELDAQPTVRVHVRARRPGVELHVRLGSHTVTTADGSHSVDDYTLVCAPAPCDADVPSGTHLFGVSGVEGHALPARDVDLAIGLDRTLEIDLDDRSAVRMAGTIVALITLIPGLAVLLVSLIGPLIERSRIDAVFVGLGAPLAAIGIAALPFAAWGDTREVVLVDDLSDEAVEAEVLVD